MSSFNTMDFTPSADGILDNMKYGGIDVSEIVQELKDNCDDAGASNISIYILPKDSDDQKLNELIICDDGRGMTCETLKNAMVLAKRHDHNVSDIGKFGVGLQNATMGLGNHITIVTKTSTTPAIGVYMNVQDMRRQHTFTPTQFEEDANTLRGQFPSNIWNTFTESISGTMISVKSIHEHHIQEVKDLVADIHRSLNFNYITPSGTQSANTVIRSDPDKNDNTHVVKQVDAFYRNSPENLIYLSETELRVFSNGRTHNVYEVVTSPRYRGCKKGKKAKTEIITGTPEKPVYYQMFPFHKGRADTSAVHCPVNDIPPGPYKSIYVRYIEVRPDPYVKEGETGAWDGFETRRRGFFFRRGNRMVGACMSLEESMDDHRNRFRMEVTFPPSLDMEMGVRTQKQMSKHLHSTPISDALRVLWRQQTNELLRIRKNEAAEVLENETSSISSNEKPKKKIKKGGIDQFIVQQTPVIPVNQYIPLVTEPSVEPSVEPSGETSVETSVEPSGESPVEPSVEHSLESSVDRMNIPVITPLVQDITQVIHPIQDIQIADKYVQLTHDSKIVSRIPGGGAASHLREWLVSVPIPLGKTKEGLFKHIGTFWNIF